MAKVITFSKQFPSYHPKAGEQTFFIEKIWASLADILYPNWKIPDAITDWDWHEYYNAIPKHHTIHAGNRFKVGDKFSPRVWSGKPYRSKQIVIAEDIEVKKVWNFKMDAALWEDECKFFLDEYHLGIEIFQIAFNDGFKEPIDFMRWFTGSGMASSKRKSFEGQIICWNDKLNYEYAGGKK